MMLLSVWEVYVRRGMLESQSPIVHTLFFFISFLPRAEVCLAHLDTFAWGFCLCQNLVLALRWLLFISRFCLLCSWCCTSAFFLSLCCGKPAFLSLSFICFLILTECVSRNSITVIKVTAVQAVENICSIFFLVQTCLPPCPLSLLLNRCQSTETLAPCCRCRRGLCLSEPPPCLGWL